MIDVTQLPLMLHVQSRDKVMYDGVINSLSAQNQNGRFDILPLHSNFVSVIEGKISFITAEGQTQEMNLNSGVLRVIENRIEIYIGFLE